MGKLYNIKHLTEVSFDKEIPRKQVLERIIMILCNDGRFYNYCDELIFINEKEKINVSPSELPGILNFLNIELSIQKEEGKRYLLFDAQHARALFAGNRLINQLPRINYFTRGPTYSKKWNLLDPGYHENERVFCLGEKIVPIQSCDLIDSITKSFLFKNEASRCNFIALLITGLLRNKYIGDRPFGANTGNRSQIGKTLASKIVSIILEEQRPEVITYKSNQEELEKNIAALFLKRDVMIFDNVKSKREIDSNVLEALITSLQPAYRILGHSKTVSKPNTAIVIMTMNGAKFCEDLRTRALPIEFYLGEDIQPSEVKFDKDYLQDYVQKNRTAILQQLCGMIETWKQKGFPACNKDFRFRNWIKDVGGIAEANGYKSIIDNLESATSSYNNELQEIGKLFDGKLNQRLSARKWGELAKREGLFYEALEGKKAATVMSSILSGHVGKRIVLQSGEYFILRSSVDKHEKIKIYYGESNNTTEIKGDEENTDIAKRSTTCCLTDCFGKGNGSFAGTAGTKTGAVVVSNNAINMKDKNPVAPPNLIPAVPAEIDKQVLTQNKTARGSCRESVKWENNNSIEEGEKHGS